MNRLITAFLFYLLFTLPSFAQPATISARHLNLEKNIALEGYDPVAYLTQNKALEGNKSITATNNTAVYYFATEANKQLFLKNPQKYLPQYGGWCAYAMGSAGKKISVDPETFKIIDGKLYLFYNAFLNNTLKSWNSDEANLKQKADANWINLIKN